jgi:hypothetical protein
MPAQPGNSRQRLYLLKLQRLQNRVLHTIGHFPRHTSVCDLHVAFEIPYVYDFIKILCRQQAEVIQNHYNPNFCNIGQDKTGKITVMDQQSYIKIETLRGITPTQIYESLREVCGDYCRS